MIECAGVITMQVKRVDTKVDQALHLLNVLVQKRAIVDSDR